MTEGIHLNNRTIRVAYIKVLTAGLFIAKAG